MLFFGHVFWIFELSTQYSIRTDATMVQHRHDAANWVTLCILTLQSCRNAPEKNVLCTKCHPWLITLQALAEKESDGMAKMIYRKDTGEILGVHIFGLHAADLIHEASNAIATKQTVQVRPTSLSAAVITFLINHHVSHLEQKIIALHACCTPEWLTASPPFWWSINHNSKCTKHSIAKLTQPRTHLEYNSRS